jgi:putative transposase
MATRYRFGDSHIPHFVTCTTVQWVDALSRPLYKDLIIDSLKYCIDYKHLKLHAWVIMNNHLHLIISSEHNKLADIVRDLKKYTSRRLIAAIQENPQESRKNWILWLFKSAGKQNSNNKNYQFWQQDNHPITLSTGEMIKQRLNYIHDNPVRAGIVSEQHHYLYSSAADYCTMQAGMLPIERLD